MEILSLIKKHGQLYLPVSPDLDPKNAQAVTTILVMHEPPGLRHRCRPGEARYAYRLRHEYRRGPIETKIGKIGWNVGQNFQIFIKF